MIRKHYWEGLAHLELPVRSSGTQDMVRLLSQEGWGTSVSLGTKEKNNFELKLGTSSFVYSLMIFERYKRRGGPPQNT